MRPLVAQQRGWSTTDPGSQPTGQERTALTCSRECPCSGQDTPYARPERPNQQNSTRAFVSLIPGTDAIESLNARYRRAVRARGHFPKNGRPEIPVPGHPLTRPHRPGEARWATAENRY